MSEKFLSGTKTPNKQTNKQKNTKTLHADSCVRIQAAATHVFKTESDSSSVERSTTCVSVTDGGGLVG